MYLPEMVMNRALRFTLFVLFFLLGKLQTESKSYFSFLPIV